VRHRTAADGPRRLTWVSGMPRLDALLMVAPDVWHPVVDTLDITGGLSGLSGVRVQ